MANALVIVAHPDDETIWMGGTILKNKNWGWTIVSLCRKDDLDRMPKFCKVCQHYNADSIISDLDDEKLEPLSLFEVKEKIKQVVPNKNYDYIFTHGLNGEYGHIRHIEIHNAVKELIKSEELSCKTAFYFSYDLSKQSVPGIPNLKVPLPNEFSDVLTKLDENQIENKINLITNIYGFKNESFETLSCNKKEAFNFS